MQADFNLIASKYREIADAFDRLGCAPPAAVTTTAPIPAAEPVKRGRPAKVEAPSSPVLIAKDEPKVDDTKVTADHPLRAELKAVAAKLISATDKPTAVAAIKLFGPNTNDMADVQLEAAIAHLTALLKKKQTNNDDV